MIVLVAFGSTGGGTAEIAGWIAEELRAAGMRVDLSPAAAVTDVARYGGLVLGPAVYATGWHADARKLARLMAGRFAGRPAWLFSSGPLDSSAGEGPLPSPRHAEVAMRELPAREHVTFGGRMTDEARGWLGHLARERHAGDFRNPERVRAWARRIADEIRSQQPGHAEAIATAAPGLPGPS